MERRAVFGRLYVYFYDEVDKRPRCLDAQWTNLRRPDPFLEVSAGRSWFRPEDLLRLAELMAVFRADQAHWGGEGRGLV